MNTKKLLLVLVCIVLIAGLFVIPTNSFADGEVIELSEADFDEARTSEQQPTDKGIYYSEGVFELEPGEYQLTANVDLYGDRLELSEGDFVIDLNGNALESSLDNAPVIYFYDGTLTIEGQGVINNSSPNEDGTFSMEFYCEEDMTTKVILEENIYQGDIGVYPYVDLTINGGLFTDSILTADSRDASIGSTLTIYGGTFESMNLFETTNLTIYNGTFNRTLWIYNSRVLIENATVLDGIEALDSRLTINGGKFSADAYAIAAEGTSVTINDGEFTARYYSALLFDKDYDDEENIPRLSICGGTFTGGESGMTLYSTDWVLLKGGTFATTGESDNNKGAIVATVDGEAGFYDLLQPTYIYSEDLVITEVENPDLPGELATQDSISVIYGGLEITNDKNQVFLGEDLTFNCTGFHTQFTELLRNYEHVDEDNYVVEPGSTILTLKADYLSTLEAGEHTFTMLYTNSRSIDVTVNIPEQEVEPEEEQEESEEEKGEPTNPKTGDDIAVWASLMLVSMIGIAGAIKYIKRK